MIRTFTFAPPPRIEAPIGLADSMRVLARHTDAAARAIAAFVVVYRELVEAEYLRTHNRLPGSDRTARLRKKRRVLVARRVEGDSERGVE